jgi:hypothetical protein
MTSPRGRPRRVGWWRYALSAVLNLTGRPPAQRQDRTRRRDAASSSYEAPLPAADPLQFGRAYWLPPFGYGNGLEALFWTTLAEVPQERVDVVLAALKEQDIPAWTAEVRGRAPSRLAPGTAPPWALWVASAQLDAAQDVLVRVLADRG